MFADRKNGTQPPSGLMMMLKAMGIEFDPHMFQTMSNAVEEIRARLQSIEEKQDKLSAKIETMMKGK